MQRLNLALLLTLLLAVLSFGQTLPTFWSGLSKPNCSAIAIEQNSPEVGDTLTVDATWTDNPIELRTEWYVNDVLAHTGSSFNTSGVTTTNDVVRVVQYGINAAGTATRSSSTITMLEGDDPPPLVAPTNTVAPSITGTPTPGYTLTCNTGSWTASPTSYSYQWTADNSNISDATSSTYVVQEGDLGKAIRVVVTATNATGTSDPATSSAKTITAAITIDSTWLADSANQGTVDGNTVYILKQSGKTYMLQTDVTTDGTAFCIANKDITLDLNGYTITYNTDDLAGASEQGRHQDAPHGVWILVNSKDTPLISGVVEAKNATIKNGKITNAHAGALSHGIYGYYGNNARIESMEITTDGKDSHTVWFQWEGSGGATICDSVLTTNTSETFNRHAGPANVHINGKLVAERNIFLGGNSGVYVAGASVITQNIIAHNGFVTNGYAIFGSAATINDNLILPTNGRGLGAGENATLNASDNVILHLEKPNAEFGEGLNPPAIRTRYNADNVHYTNNVSLGIGGGDYTAASSIYITGYGSGINHFENNDATVILIGAPSGDKYALPVTIEGTGYVSGSVGPGIDVIANNHFKSNHLMFGMVGFEGGGRMSEPLRDNTWDWEGGGDAYTNFMAAVEAKFATFTLSASVEAAAEAHIAVIDSLIDDLIGEQGLQSSRSFWRTNGYQGDRAVYADILDSTFGSGVNPKSFGSSTTSGDTPSWLGREGFTKEVQITSGSNPLANTEVTVTTAQGDEYTATTDANGYVTLTFYRFALEKSAGTQSYAIVDRTQSTVTVDGYTPEVIDHESIPATKEFIAE